MPSGLEKLQRLLIRSGPPVNTTEIDEAETTIGAAFPSLLRTVWVDVGAGGLTGHPHSLLRPSVVAASYARDRAEDRREPWHWPQGLVRIADFGCGITACLDLLTPEAPIWWFDPNLDAPQGADHAPPWQSHVDFADWLDAFADGSAFVEYWP